jgi:hypothetical protein
LTQLDDTLKDSLLRALGEERYDDLVIMLANLLRTRQNAISAHARAALPVDSTQCLPLCTNRLTHHEVEMFDLRTTGWYVIAVQECRIVGAEPFPYTMDDPEFRDRVGDYVQSVGDYYGDAPAMYGAWLEDGVLSEFKPLMEFQPECRGG